MRAGAHLVGARARIEAPGPHLLTIGMGSVQSPSPAASTALSWPVEHDLVRLVPGAEEIVDVLAVRSPAGTKRRQSGPSTVRSAAESLCAGVEKACAAASGLG